MTTALPIRQNNATQKNSTDRQNGSGGKGSSPTRPSIYPVSPSNPLFTAENMGGSPMSFGMSFGGAGGMMKSWKQSFVNQNGLGARGMSFGDRNGFGSFKNANGSFAGYMEDNAMDGADPFLNSGGDSTLAFSFTGRNGSFRSPSALGIPIVLGSFNGGQSFGGGRSYGMSMSGKSFTGSNTNWGRVKSNIMKKEADFCKDFMCCGQDLGNLHDLLEHYEEAHVVVVNSPSSASQMDLSLEMDADSKWAYGGDELDVDMEELDQESPESEVSTATNSTQTSPLPGHATPGLIASKIATGQAITSALNNLALNEMKPSSSSSGSRSKSSDDISAFDSYVISSPPKAVEPDLSMRSTKVKPTNLAASRRALHGGINGRPATETPTKNAFGLNVRRQSPEPAKTTTGFTAVAPNVLFTNANAPTPIASPAVAEVTPTTFGAPPPAESTPSPVSSNATPAGWKVSAPSASQADLTPQPSLFSTHRPFRCPQPGCQKSYKQANGLKYHMLKGQCNFEVRDAMEWAGLTQEEAEERAKPYACAAGDGCNKRYRQANGLKYHYMNSGLHGEIGLILLAQGQHPMPNMNPKETKPRPAPHPAAARPGARAAGLAPGGWIKNAVRSSGKELGLPLTGTDNPQQRKGEDAVLFSTDEALAL